jgi:hypothetical protein
MSTPERCGAPAKGFKLTCDLDRGHAKSLSDWHQGSAETKQTASDYEWISKETVRWAPAFYELDREEAKP